MIIGKTRPAVPSDEGHCVVTEGNPAVCRVGGMAGENHAQSHLVRPTHREGVSDHQATGKGVRGRID